MIILPAKDEILIFPFSKEQVRRRLIKELTLKKTENKFIGWIEDDKFQISQRITRPNNFVPLIEGLIDSSTKGSIIFINYRLMFSTRMFLLFWSLILIFLTLFFMLRYEAYMYGSVAFLVGIGNYLIVYFNFKKQIRITRDLFINMVNSTT